MAQSAIERKQISVLFFVKINVKSRSFVSIILGQIVSYFLKLLDCRQTSLLTSGSEQDVSTEVLLEQTFHDGKPDSLVGASDNCNFTNHFQKALFNLESKLLPSRVEK
jgi:hypothetical protein